MKFEKKRNSNRQKNTFLFKIIQYSLQTRTSAEIEFIHFNLFSRFIIFMVLTFQQIGILIIHSQENIFKTNDGSVKTAYIISQIVLPNQFIMNQSFLKGGYLLPLLIILMVYISLIIQYFLHVKRNKHHQLAHKDNQNTLSVITIIRVYFQLLYLPLLSMPFLQLSLQSIKLNFENNLIQAAFGILAVILQFMTLFTSLLFRESIKIKLKNLAVIYQSSLDYSIIILNFTLVVIEYLDIEKYAKFYLMVVIIVITNSIQLFNYITNFPKLYCDIKYEMGFTILILTISLVLFIVVAANILVQNLAILVLILFPLAYYYFSTQQQLIHFEVMLSDKMNSSSQMIQYRVANIIDEFHEISKSFINKPVQIYTLYLYLIQHRSNCDSTRCLCENENIQFEQIVKLYLKDQVQQFGQSISQIKDQSNQFPYFIHYLSLINFLGMNTNAFQQSNIAIFEESGQTSKMGTVNVDKQLSDRKHSSQSNEHASSSNNQKSKYSKESIPNIKLGDTSFFQKQKLLIIQTLIKTSMSSEFLKDNAQSLSDNLQHAVKLFLDSEQNNDRLKRKVMKILVKKRDYFTQLLSQNFNFNLFRESKKLIIQIDTLDVNLQKMYQQFPSQKMQALNAFYQAEIRNNYFTAFKIANITSVSDEKLLKMQSQTTFDLFSSKVVYLLVGFDEKSHKPIIQGHSNLVHEFFGIKMDQFKMIKSIDPLLPNGFSNIHQKLISQFLQTGKSKYFRQIEQSFCTTNLKELKVINFFFDIDSKNLDNMTFACFFQDYQHQNTFIFVSLGCRILSFTKNIGQKLGYPSKVQERLFENLYSTNITNVIPNFQELVSQEISLLELTRKQRAINLNQITMYFPEMSSLEKKSRVSLESHSKSLKVDGTIFLQNVNNQVQYYIIEIIEAKVGNSLTGDKTLAVNNESINVTQEFIDEEELQSFDILNEEIVNQPNAIESLNKEDQGRSQFGIHLEIKQQQQNNNNQSASFYQQQNISIISPKNIGIRLLQNNTPQMKSQRQQFFSAEQNEDEFNASESVVGTQKQQHQQEINNKIDLLQMDDIDHDLQENIKMQMQVEQYDQRIVHIDDIGSQVSSIAGMKKSKYFKKYELLEKMLVAQKFSISFKIMVGIVFIYLLFALIMQIVLIVKSKDDLNRFLQELDMVQIRSNIMGPVDKYIVCLNAATNYIVIAYYFNFISIQQAIIKMSYSSEDIIYTYEELKSSFSNQLSNPYLDPFFQDQYIEVYQSTYLGLQQYNLTIREALNIYLQAAYLFQNVNLIQVMTLDVTQSFIVYLFKNYENFTELFKSLNVQILEYSINRSKQVAIQWWSIFIPTIVICGILCISQFIFYNFYLKQYQKILAMFQMIESVWVQRDIDRYKGILALLAKDSDVIFKYTFDIDLKEKFLQAEDFRKDKLASNQKNKKLKTQYGSSYSKQTILSKIPSMIGFCCLFLFSFSFFFLSNQLGQTYFTKYEATTNFFNRLSDLSIATSGIFSMRQLSYQIQTQTSEVFYFFGHNATYFLKEFSENIEIINDFLTMITTFDQSKYLTSIQFFNQMQKLLNSDVCQFLPQQKVEAAQSHCDAVYNGVLRRGFQETLIKIRDSLLNEQIDSGNFQAQAYSTQEELEIGLISYDVVNQLRLQFQVELISYTNNLINQILTINLVFILLVLLLMALLFTALLAYFKKEFRQVKSFIQLLPQTSLLLDVQLDREIRQMILKDNLI